jgi:hypothetical protein
VRRCRSGRARTRSFHRSNEIVPPLERRSGAAVERSTLPVCGLATEPIDSGSLRRHRSRVIDEQVRHHYAAPHRGSVVASQLVPPIVSTQHGLLGQIASNLELTGLEHAEGHETGIHLAKRRLEVMSLRHRHILIHETDDRTVPPEFPQTPHGGSRHRARSIEFVPGNSLAFVTRDNPRHRCLATRCASGTPGEIAKLATSFGVRWSILRKNRP